MIRWLAMIVASVSIALIAFAGEQSHDLYNDAHAEGVQETRKQPSAEDIFISKLSGCESRNNPSAVNPQDLDGTPSYGRFQFKIKTWKAYVRRYDLWKWRSWEEADYWNSIYAGDMQEVVVRKMLHDSKVNMANEFPDCWRLHRHILGR